MASGHRLTNIEGRSETRGRSETQNQPGRINNFWRFLCCVSDRQIVNEVPTPLTTRAVIPDRGQGSDSDQGDRPGTHSTTLVTGRTSGWHGPSSETLRDLLQKVVKLDMSQYSGTNDLHTAIYHLYILNKKQQGFTYPIDDKAYQVNLQKISCPGNILSQSRKLEEGTWGGYLHFIKQDSTAQIEDRVTLNIQPDRIPDVTQYLVNEMARSDYISQIKVAYTTDFATQSLSNIIIYLNLVAPPHLDPNIRVDDFQRIVKRCARYTRPGNPAMMQTLASGTALAEERGGVSFGNAHVEPIVEAIKALQANSEKFDNVDTLLEAVKKQFKAHGIDSKEPHLYLRKQGVRQSAKPAYQK